MQELLTDLIEQQRAFIAKTVTLPASNLMAQNFETDPSDGD